MENYLLEFYFSNRCSGKLGLDHPDLKGIWEERKWKSENYLKYFRMKTFYYNDNTKDEVIFYLLQEWENLFY